MKNESKIILVGNLTDYTDPENNDYPTWDIPSFQRDAGVWPTSHKQFLIDSLKKEIPFNNITIVYYNARYYVVDGLQRITCLTQFMNNEFVDKDKKKWSEWSLEEREKAKNFTITINDIKLDREKGEGWADIIELFRRVNTQGKPLCAGELIYSCIEDCKSVAFVHEVFGIEDSKIEKYKDDIITFRSKWKCIFCKKDDYCKEKKSYIDFAALVIPLLTGNNEAITTSFSKINDNGVKVKELTEKNYEEFFEKASKLFEYIEEANKYNYFTKSSKGFPKFSRLAPLIYIVNNEFCNAEPKVTAEELNKFYIELDRNEDFAKEYDTFARKNLSVNILKRQVEEIIKPCKSCVHDEEVDKFEDTGYDL